jgi:ribokinase
MPQAIARSAEIIVVGSINADLVVRGDRLPQPGETVIGGQFRQVSGGKGANQAVAAARLSRSPVRFLGAVGDDALGRDLRATLGAESNLDITRVRTVAGQATGVALIMVDAGGQNAISVASGANAGLRPEILESVEASTWRSARVLLASLETPLDTVLAALRQARRHGLATVLNPAPAAEPIANREWLEVVDVLTPNETELAILSRMPVDGLKSAELAARHLQTLGARTVVATLGARGALLVPDSATGERAAWIEPVSVSAVDTTAAGDAFNGALAVAMAEGLPVIDAARWATRAAAISVTRAGAQPSLPRRHELEETTDASRTAPGELRDAVSKGIDEKGVEAKSNGATQVEAEGSGAEGSGANGCGAKGSGAASGGAAVNSEEARVGGGDVLFRLYRPDDLETLKRLTVDSFSGVTLEQNIEEALGLLGGRDWRWRKARHLDEDVAANASGIFIAERAGRIVGYITTRVNRATACGRVPNLAVAADCRNLGLGRQLIELALHYFRAEGLEYAVIETMARNAIGQHLYPACGFEEVARQVHFARRL